MPGFLLHQGAMVQCAHLGTAQPTAPNPSVTVSLQPTVVVTDCYTVAGCPLPPPSNGNGPCITASWTTAATRLTSNGAPLLLADSQATCAPTGTPLLVTTVQTRVTGV
ncbi:MAG: hypothetical protein WBX27_17105 [Specibacter sp.]